MARKKQETALPKGFTAITGFGESWPGDNTKVGDMLRGTVIEYDEITTTRDGKKVQVQQCKIETKGGKVYTVWESAGLRGLFDDEDYTECEVAIIYRGLGKKQPGKNPPRLYHIGYAE